MGHSSQLWPLLPPSSSSWWQQEQHPWLLRFTVAAQKGLVCQPCPSLGWIPIFPLQGIQILICPHCWGAWRRLKIQLCKKTTWGDCHFSAGIMTKKCVNHVILIALWILKICYVDTYISSFTASRKMLQLYFDSCAKALCRYSKEKQAFCRQNLVVHCFC